MREREHDLPPPPRPRRVSLRPLQVMKAPLCFAPVEYIHNSAWDAPRATVYFEEDGAVMLSVRAERRAARGGGWGRAWPALPSRGVRGSSHVGR